jgi:hypothetical protein
MSALLRTPDAGQDATESAAEATGDNAVTVLSGHSRWLKSGRLFRMVRGVEKGRCNRRFKRTGGEPGVRVRCEPATADG